MSDFATASHRRSAAIGPNSPSAPPDDPMPAWRMRSACASYEPDLFFPENKANENEAKKVCEECPVLVDCLQYALRNNERHGVWGGLGQSQRKKLHRRAQVTGI